MAWLTGHGGARPSPAMSWLTAFVGFGILLAVVMFFVNPLLGGGVFVLVWLATLVGIIGYHIWNATSDGGVHHTKFNFKARHRPNDQATVNFSERLRELEELRRDGLISDDEYQQKRREIMESRW